MGCLAARVHRIGPTQPKNKQRTTNLSLKRRLLGRHPARTVVGEDDAEEHEKERKAHGLGQEVQCLGP